MAEALLIIDYQNDFTPPEGALAVEGGDEIITRLNEEARDDRYDLVVATRDWHPPNHKSFAEHGGEWPRHCVQGTEGAELDPGLDTTEVDLVFDKGADPETGGYSAFETGELTEILRDRDVDRVRVAGLATDVCVHQSAIDALEEDLTVEVISGAVRGVDPDDSRVALEEIEREGGRLVS